MSITTIFYEVSIFLGLPVLEPHNAVCWEGKNLIQNYYFLLFLLQTKEKMTSRSHSQLLNVFINLSLHELEIDFYTKYLLHALTCSIYSILNTCFYILQYPNTHLIIYFEFFCMVSFSKRILYQTSKLSY